MCKSWRPANNFWRSAAKNWWRKISTAIFYCIWPICSIMDCCRSKISMPSSCNCAANCAPTPRVGMCLLRLLTTIYRCGASKMNAINEIVIQSQSISRRRTWRSQSALDGHGKWTNRHRCAVAHGHRSRRRNNIRLMRSVRIESDRAHIGQWHRRQWKNMPAKMRRPQLRQLWQAPVPAATAHDDVVPSRAYPIWMCEIEMVAITKCHGSQGIAASRRHATDGPRTWWGRVECEPILFIDSYLSILDKIDV